MGASVREGEGGGEGEGEGEGKDVGEVATPTTRARKPTVLVNICVIVCFTFVNVILLYSRPLAQSM